MHGGAQRIPPPPLLPSAPKRQKLYANTSTPNLSLLSRKKMDIEEQTFPVINSSLPVMDSTHVEEYASYRMATPSTPLVMMSTHDLENEWDAHVVRKFDARFIHHFGSQVPPHVSRTPEDNTKILVSLRHAAVDIPKADLKIVTLKLRRVLGKRKAH